MASRSYSELLTAEVEVKMAGFEASLKAADRVLKDFAKGAKRTGSNLGFSAAGRKIINGAVDGMQIFATDVMNESLVQVPKDTTTLANSARLFEARRDGQRVVVEMGYGYGDEVNPKTGLRAAQYALPVHEIWSAEHAPPTKSHYLVDPLLERASRFGPELKIWIQATTTLYGAERGSTTAMPSYTAVVRNAPAIGARRRGPGGRFIKNPPRREP